MSGELLGEEPALTTDAVDTWHRVHPISPLVRGWVAVAAILFVFGRNSLDELFYATDGGIGVKGPNLAELWVVFAVTGVAVLVFSVAFFLQWRFTRYQVTDEHVHINSGVVFRQQRRARIDRVQAIDVVQPLLARAFGLAELKFEVADGGKSALKLSFLKLREAKRLRAAILARAAGVHVDPDAPSEVQEAPESHALALPPSRIFAAALCSGTSVFAVLVIAGAAVAWTWTGEWAVVVAAVPFLIGIFASYWQSITTDFNFRVAVSPDGVRLHYGMLETRSQTIPPGRVQAVDISQGPMWRPLGWYKVRVNVAGYGSDSSDNGTRIVLLPVGTLDEVMTVLGLVFPDPGVGNPFEVFTAGLKGTADAHGFVHSPRQARWIDPLTWRRSAYRATDTALLCRHGRFFRVLQVVPHERTQSLALRQGPVMRALGLANFELHSTVGPIRPLVRHMSTANALALFDQQAVRAATARRIHRKEKWLAQDEQPAAPAPVQAAQVQPAPAAPAAAHHTLKENHHGD